MRTYYKTKQLKLNHVFKYESFKYIKLINLYKPIKLSSSFFKDFFPILIKFAKDINRELSSKINLLK